MISSVYEIIGHTLTWISLVHALIACVISVLMVVIIICHALHNRLRYEEKFTFILSTNIYLAVLMYALSLSIMNIDTLLDDLAEREPFLPWCIFQGYWIIVSAHTMYYTFVVQVTMNSIGISLAIVLFSSLGCLSSFSYCVFQVSTVAITMDLYYKHAHSHRSRKCLYMSCSAVA